jgi:hypothetical protein
MCLFLGQTSDARPFLVEGSIPGASAIAIIRTPMPNHLKQIQGIEFTGDAEIRPADVGMRMSGRF